MGRYCGMHPREARGERRPYALTPFVTFTPMALEIGHYELTNRVGRGHVCTIDVGERTLAMAQRVMHQVV